MAMAYEQNGKKSDAAKMYEELLAVEGKRAEREELYRKVTELFLADKKNDDAMRQNPGRSDRVSGFRGITGIKIARDMRKRKKKTAEHAGRH